ncbi:MAG: hypothetical protein H6697_02310 [Myxococcales bacterium]|nr:hypothetical protein [Myxococcales bacterium]
MRTMIIFVFALLVPAALTGCADDPTFPMGVPGANAAGGVPSLDVPAPTRSDTSGSTTAPSGGGSAIPVGSAGLTIEYDFPTGDSRVAIAADYLGPDSHEWLQELFPALPAPITLRVQSCGDARPRYDLRTHVVVACLEDFLTAAEVVRAGEDDIDDVLLTAWDAWDVQVIGDILQILLVDLGADAATPVGDLASAWIYTRDEWGIVVANAAITLFVTDEPQRAATLVCLLMGPEPGLASILMDELADELGPECRSVFDNLEAALPQILAPYVDL